VALVAASAIVEGMLRSAELAQPLLSVLVLLAVTPAFLWRRSKPLLMLVIVFAAMAPIEVFLPEWILYTGVAAIVLPYALFRWGSGRELVIGSAVILGSLGLSFVRGGGLDDLIGGFALLLTVAILGAAFRYRASSRQRQLDRIKLQEREGLARDLHDTVAHHVSAIAIRAQAGLAMAPHDPDAATAALEVIEAEAAKTLSEMRSMVRVLRQGESVELAPSPRLSDIEQLAGTRPGGATVAVRVGGDAESVPPTVAAAVYRLVQESVTNALRHGRSVTRIDVSVQADAGGVLIAVANDGEVALSPAPGYGITGMMERAALLGGTCQAGPTPGGGWSVTAVLPRVGWTP
jgi:signal transduction histidine kinase